MPVYSLKTLVEVNKIYETITITKNEALHIESATRNQSKSNKEYELRAGRVPVSVMKEALSTKLKNPSLLFIKKNSYRYKFRNAATDWGVEHEKSVSDYYYKLNSTHHFNFAILETGLFINPKWPHTGASPDDIAECSCCEGPCLEIKCPSIPLSSILLMILLTKKNSYLYSNEDELFPKKQITLIFSKFKHKN